MMRESIGEREAPNINNRLSSSGPCSPIDIPKSKSSGNLSSTSIPRPKSYDGRPLRSPVNNSPQTRAEETVPLKRITSASNSVGTESSEGATSINKYMPSSYFGILGDGQPAPPIFVMSERDFSQHMSSIQASLLNKDDWQARQNGLLKLQGLLKGIFENDEMNQDYLSQETVAQLLIEYIRTSLHETVTLCYSTLLILLDFNANI